MVKVHRTNFTRLGTDTTRSEPHSCNIIFIHGLKGHPERTWGHQIPEQTATAERKADPKRTFKTLFGRKKPIASDNPPNPHHPFWPHEFLTEDIPEAVVWTYGYNADIINGLSTGNNKNSISQHGRDLAIRFERDIDNEYPVIFVAHSLGGIILKDAIRRSEACKSRTVFIVFLGTPHRGTYIAGWGKIASNLARLALQDSNNELLDSLNSNSEGLSNIHDDFVKLAVALGLKIHSFQESRGVSGIVGLEDKVVEDFSSRVGLPHLEQTETMDADHRQMAKCTSRDDDRYRAIRDVIKQFLRTSTKSTIPGVTDSHLTLQMKAVEAIQSTESEEPIPSNGCNSTSRGIDERIFCVPFPENRRFVGREDILKQLQQTFFADGYQKTALYGLGGIGKSQIALRFAFWVEKKKPEYSVFWISALSKASFDQSCHEIMTEANIQPTDESDPKRSVQVYLGTRRAGKWLLIIDNVDDDEILDDAIQNYLPRNRQGLMLFTTRSVEVGVNFANSSVIKIDEMSKEESEYYLERSLIDKNLIQSEAAVSSLLDELQYLPLAITQAAAYMNKNSTTIAQYLSLFKRTDSNMIQLLSSQFYDDTRYQSSENSVVATWILSFGRIEETDPLAAKCLQFLAWVEPKGIPQAILPEDTELELSRAIGTLIGYSLLTKRTEPGVFDMHSLIHLVTQVWVRQHCENDTLSRCISRLNQKLPKSVSWENRDVWRQYLPHALKALNSCPELGTDGCSLGNRIGVCLDIDFRTIEGIQVLEKVVSIEEKSLAEDDPSLLSSQCGLARAYQANRQTKEAIILLEKVVSLQASLAKDHPDRILSQYSLAIAYQANGQVEEAIALLEKVASVDEGVPIKERSLGGNDLDHLAIQHGLAVAYKANGQVGEAIILLEKVVSIEEKSLAEDHPYCLTSQHELAIAYEANGQVEDAIALLEKVISVQKGSLAEDDSSRLGSQYALAIAYEANGQVEDAIALLEKVISVQKGSLAEDHPDRLVSQNTLAVVYEANGQVEEAIALLEKVISIEEGSLAEDHPDLLASQHALAVAYRANGQVKEAIAILEKVVSIKKKSLAEGHPDRLVSEHALAVAYRTNGQVAEAIALLEKVISIEEGSLAEDHPDRLASQHALAVAYRANGQVKEAIAILEKVVSIQESLAEDHPNRLTSQHELAVAYRANGQVEEAIALLDKIVFIKEGSLAQGHRSRVVSEEMLELHQNLCLSEIQQ